MNKVKVGVRFNSYRDSTGGYNPEDEWSRDSTSTSWEFDSIKINEKSPKWSSGSYEEFKIDESWLNSQLHIVYAIHSSGDSFGHDQGCSLSVIGVYNNHDDAKNVQKAIKKDYEENPDYNYSGNSISVKLLDGTDQLIHVGSWKGYFESLDSVNVETAKVNK